jgi:hypothetical protein
MPNRQPAGSRLCSIREHPHFDHSTIRREAQDDTVFFDEARGTRRETIGLTQKAALVDDDGMV